MIGSDKLTKDGLVSLLRGWWVSEYCHSRTKLCWKNSSSCHHGHFGESVNIAFTHESLNLLKIAKTQHHVHLCNNIYLNFNYRLSSIMHILYWIILHACKTLFLSDIKMETRLEGFFRLMKVNTRSFASSRLDIFSFTRYKTTCRNFRRRERRKPKVIGGRWDAFYIKFSKRPHPFLQSKSISFSSPLSSCSRGLDKSIITRARKF